MITIFIKHQQSGQPLPNQLLSLEFCGDKIGWTPTVATDEVGSVTFNIQPEIATLFVNGRRQFQGGVVDGVTLFVSGRESPACAKDYKA